MSWVTLNHLILRLESRVGELCDVHLLVEGLLGRNDGRIGDERKVYARIGHQIGLELGQIDVERAVEAQRGRDGAEHLGHQSIDVRVRGSLDAERARTNVEDGLVVDHEGAVRVLESGVRGENGVVGLDDSRRDLRRRIHGKLEFALFAVVDAQTLHEQRGEARAGATAERVKDEKALEAGARVR